MQLFTCISHCCRVLQRVLNFCLPEENIPPTHSPQHPLECWNPLPADHACHKPTHTKPFTQTTQQTQQLHRYTCWKKKRSILKMNIFKETAAFFLLVYPNLRGAPRPASLPSISADDSSSKLGSSICQDRRKSSATHPLQIRITATPLSAWGVDLWLNLIKELLSSTEDMLEFCKLQEVLLQGFLVGVDFF